MEMAIEGEVSGIANERIELITEYMPFTVQWIDEMAELKKAQK